MAETASHDDQPGTIVESCGSHTWINIKLVDPQGNPVADEAYEITKEDEDPRTGSLDENGTATIDDIPAGTWKLTFPNRKFDEWHRIRDTSPPATWLEIKLIDHTGTPVADEPYEILLPDQETLVSGNLNARGRARIDAQTSGICKLNFPQRHAKDWWPVST